mmetsp:Transcript_7232/g.13714  ORF Transcript_7232/g.13714 Transcript_7232/m.13714 type:complete len:561 (-) Transcript_7232:189-1871(-)|eukprot:CAMPEP_0175147482 /NCGR_PEP_ID=MMETSP0087-20121206/16021_1 /TAXON_ID=136419 /ORGANISM="Unknown Unknown, Strain D1" /LENGTH=560 /DNA_ID=CAMNT_0016432685 /DNA_START=61 /DNA_END=1743 /DNA_ORIENTATION=+
MSFLPKLTSNDGSELNPCSRPGSATKGVPSTSRLPTISNPHQPCNPPPLSARPPLSRQTPEQQRAQAQLKRRSIKPQWHLAMHSTLRLMDTHADITELKASYKAIIKMLNAIVKRPEDKKYSKIRMDNIIIRKFVSGIAGATDFLLASGFAIDNGAGSHATACANATGRQTRRRKISVGTNVGRKSSNGGANDRSSPESASESKSSSRKNSVGGHERGNFAAARKATPPSTSAASSDAKTRAAAPIKNEPVASVLIRDNHAVNTTTKLTSCGKTVIPVERAGSMAGRAKKEKCYLNMKQVDVPRLKLAVKLLQDRYKQLETKRTILSERNRAAIAAAAYHEAELVDACLANCGYQADEGFDGLCSVCYEQQYLGLSSCDTFLHYGYTAEGLHDVYDDLGSVLRVDMKNGSAPVIFITDRSAQLDPAHLNTGEPQHCLQGCGYFGMTFMGLCGPCYQKAAGIKPRRSPHQKLHSARVKLDAVRRFRMAERLKQKNKKRCWTCRRRVGITGIPCRCGFVFCGKHRYPEEHTCHFDHRGLHKKNLAEQNPLVEAAKFTRIEDD